MLLWLGSQLGEMIQMVTSPPENVESQAPVLEIATPDNAQAVAPDKDGSPATDPSRQGTSLGGGNLDAAPTVDTAPAGTPETGGGSTEMQRPAGDGELDVTLGGENAANPADVAVAVPNQPNLDTAPATAQDAPAQQQTTADVMPVAPELPAINNEGGLEAVEVETPAIVAPEPEAEVAETETVDVTPKVEQEPFEPKQNVVVETDPNAGSTLAPVNEIGNLAQNVRTNRLPTIGGASEEAVEEDVTAATTSDGPAIQVYAADFENLNDRPVMAVLLIDAVGAEHQTLPFPVTYAVDANRADAVDAMIRFRRAGSEVVALAPLPAGAKPSDVEVTFAQYLSDMSEVVGFMDTRDAGFQTGRLVATQVTQILAEHGLGMITYSRGLNSAIQVSERQGVPAQLVFREFDNDGQEADDIKRFMDQAAFRAGQQSGVILVGHNRPETVKALLEWGLGNRAETVALAPVSVVLQQP